MTGGQILLLILLVVFLVWLLWKSDGKGCSCCFFDWDD